MQRAFDNTSQGLSEKYIAGPNIPFLLGINQNIKILYFFKKNDVSINIKESLFYFKMEADRGNDKAIYRYESMRYNGAGFDHDNEEAAYYFKLAADKGNVKAILSYADYD